MKLIFDFFQGHLIDQGSYYSLTKKSDALKLFLRMKSIERKRSRKYTEDDFDIDLSQLKRSTSEMDQTNNNNNLPNDEINQNV
jgi:hypothetical protein